MNEHLFGWKYRDCISSSEWHDYFSVLFLILIQLQNTELHTLFPTYATKLRYIRAKCKIQHVPSAALSLTIYFILQYCLVTLHC